MLIQKKVQLKEEDITLVEKICDLLNYKSQSEYFRVAICEKIKADKQRIREMKRQKAMEAYGQGNLDNVFESLEGEDFESR